METLLAILLELINETLAAAIVVVAASFLLYNLTRNLKDRVARTSSILLACVTAAYITDVFVSLGPSRGTLIATLRLQWIGIAFLPAAMFHLSDALLATTGRTSRGRRRRVVRIAYLIGAVFLVLAAFTDYLVQPNEFQGQINLRPSFMFPVYIAYFLVLVTAAFLFVGRARHRCLTRDTRRRMGYLQFAMLTPAIGIFPFSLVLGPGTEFSVWGLLLVNLGNFVVIFMLVFLAYPLSFFGSRIPDRVVKVELLRFLMRGPATGLLALVTIIFTAPTTRILGLPGQSFMPFAVVAVVLLWQWMTALSLPWLEQRLVYRDEDIVQLARLQDLSERLLTYSDLHQLLEAILASTCDYLRVGTAFVANLNEDEPELTAAVGPARPTASLLQEELARLRDLFETLVPEESDLPIHKWHSYWILPLYSKRTNASGSHALLGILGIQARAAEIDLSSDEQTMLHTFLRRAEQAMDDIALQGEIFAALEGLLPQIALTRTNAVNVEFRPGNQPVAVESGLLIDREQLVEQVRAALRHYWGGPGLTSSRLIELQVVRSALPENDNNPSRALRAVLLKAIEKQRPAGERKMNSPEWTIYNILDMRFIQRNKVASVAPKLYMSEPDLYRKQRVAIEAIADTLLDMETSSNGSSNSH